MPVQLNNAGNVLSTREEAEEEKLPIIAHSDECGDPKDYGSSKHNRKEKSRGKNRGKKFPKGQAECYSPPKLDG
jgi:hypothetical protein